MPREEPCQGQLLSEVSLIIIYIIIIYIYNILVIYNYSFSNKCFNSLPFILAMAGLINKISLKFFLI